MNPYTPKHSNDRFSAVDLDNPAAVKQAFKDLVAEYRRLRDGYDDHERRVRSIEDNTRAMWVALAGKPNKSEFPRAYDQEEARKLKTRFDTWGVRAWAIVMLVIAGFVGYGIKYITDPKPQNPPLRYDKDGIPIDR